MTEIPQHFPERKISKIRLDGEVLASVACLALACVFFGFFMRDRNSAKHDQASAVELVRGVSASDLLDGRADFLGDPKAPNTLVEFGDYECPPCRATQAKLKTVLEQYHGRVKIDFRHMPLTELHPYALGAAKLVESSRGSKNFWVLHGLLFTSNLNDPGTWKELRKRFPTNTDEPSIKKQIAGDKDLAERMEVRGTPTFLLCRKDGSVVRLRTLEALEAALQ